MREETHKQENKSQDTGLTLLAHGQLNRSGLKNFIFSVQRFTCCETAALVRQGQEYFIPQYHVNYKMGDRQKNYFGTPFSQMDVTTTRILHKRDHILFFHL